MKTRADELNEAFEAYDEAHPEVRDLFRRYTLQAIRAGRTHYSANAIFERIRWHYEVDRGEDDWKLNNNFRALYARQFMRDHPQYEGFFRTRTRRSEAQPASDMPELRPSHFVTYPNADRPVA